MSNETVLAGTSPVESADPFAGHEPTLAEYASYRQSGELPERFKPADNAVPAPAQDSSEGDQPESASESETDHQQEQPKPQAKKLDAKGRIAQIDTQIESLWSQDEPDVIKIAQLEATKDKIEQRAGLKRKTESAPVTPQQSQPQAQPQNYQEWRKSAFKPSEWVTEYAKANPDATYEDANAAMSDFLDEVRTHFRTREQQAQQQARDLQAKVNQAHERYGDVEGVIRNTVSAIMGDQQIPLAVKEMLNDSEVLPDLLFKLGSDDKELSKFLQMAKQSPTKAARQIAELERGIADELSNDTESETARNEKGQFVAKTTEPPAPKKTSAPKPPSPVGGGSSRTFDVNDDSSSADEWQRKRNAQVYRKNG